MSDRVKDLVIVGASALAAFVLSQVLADPRYEVALFFGILFGATAVVKALLPTLPSAKAVSWKDLIVTASVAVVSSLLVFNADVLGGWSMIAAFGLMFAYGLWRLIVIARRGDGHLF